MIDGKVMMDINAENALKANNASDTTLATTVANLSTTVGNSNSGLVKSVNDLTTTVGDDDSGLVKSVNSLSTTVGDADSGLVKTVAGLSSDVTSLQTTAGFVPAATLPTTAGDYKLNVAVSDDTITYSWVAIE